MDNKYVIIEFEGDFSKVENHIKEKINCQSDDFFLNGSNRIFIKIPADDHDDLFFFRNYEVDEQTKTKYVSMQDTTRDDYLHKREEFIELSESAKRVVIKAHEPVKTVLDRIDSLPISRMESLPIMKTATVSDTKFSVPVTATTKEIYNINEEVKFSNDPMTFINRAFMDVSLPSKQPLQSNDPFNYLISTNYLVGFTFVSILILNLIYIIG